jgi:hypothetical protein
MFDTPAAGNLSASPQLCLKRHRMSAAGASGTEQGALSAENIYITTRQCKSNRQPYGASSCTSVQTEVMNETPETRGEYPTRFRLVVVLL